MVLHSFNLFLCLAGYSIKKSDETAVTRSVAGEQLEFSGGAADPDFTNAVYNFQLVSHNIFKMLILGVYIFQLSGVRYIVFRELFLRFEVGESIHDRTD